jgi:UMF1 family MFS transporter
VALSDLLNRLGLHRPELRAWAMYDWANSAMVTVIMTAVFPPFFSAVAAANLAPQEATARFGIATALCIVVAALSAPLLGAIADFAGIKKRLLAAFLFLGSGAVAAMFFLQRGDWLAAALLFMLANIGATGSFVFYDALLPHVASVEEVDRVSTAGYALGYIGGGILLALNLLWITHPGWFGLPSGPGLSSAQATLPVRLAFLSVAVWWLVFSIPLFRRVPEPPRRLEPDEAVAQSAVRVASARLRETFGELRQYRHAFVLLLAFLLYNDGINTIIRMATIYGAEIGVERDTMILAVMITQFVGVPFAFLFGLLAGWIGTKRSVILGLFVYMGITVLGYFMTNATHFLMLAILVGMVQGGTQALSRSLFASMIPRHKSGELFGFFGIMERFGGVLGTGVMTTLTLLTGHSRNGILAIVVFFIVGALLLRLVDVPEGQRIARAADAQALPASNGP